MNLIDLEQAMDADLLAKALKLKYKTPHAAMKALGLPSTLLAMDSAMPRRAFDQEELNGFSEEELEDLLEAVQTTMGDRAALRRSRDGGRDRISPDRRPRARDLAVGPQEGTGVQGVGEHDPSGESPWQDTGRDRRYGQDAKPRPTYADRFPDSARIRFW